MHGSVTVKASPTHIAPSSPVANTDQTNEVSIATSATPKEKREFDHHRQRVKKAAETANLRLRKLANATKQLYISQPRSSPNKGPKGTGGFVDVADLDGPLPDSGAPIRVESEGSHSGKLEVSLADFIVTRKARKGIDNDFEFIPHIRSVIILEDNQSHDVAIDEPWEYISGVDDNQARLENSKPISYAMVVAREA